MKKVSVVVACYNEEGNVEPLAREIARIFREELPGYGYELLFIDNDSKDRTREILRGLCREDPEHVAAIFNTRNMGSIRSSVYGLLQATGDCVVKMSADFQDPPEMLVDFVRAWEDGYRMVLAIKEGTKEKRIMRFTRKLYYALIKKTTEIKHIDHFVGYGLYDRSFIEVVRETADPILYFRGIVAELGYTYKPVYYVQPERKSGKSSFNFYRLYDYAMLGITSYSKVPLRAPVFIGGFGAGLTVLAALVTLILRLALGSSFHPGTFLIINTILFMGFVQLICLGLIGEYLINMNIRILDRPLVVEEERINLPALPGVSGNGQTGVPAAERGDAAGGKETER